MFATPLAATTPKIIKSGRVFTFGDSISLGDGLASGANRYSTLLASYLSATDTNLSRGGDFTMRLTNFQVGGYAPQDGDVVLIATGFNDYRFRGVNESAANQVSQDLRSAISWAAVRDTRKVFSQTSSTALNPAMTFSGSWSVSDLIKGQAAQSRAGAYTTASGDYAQCHVSGDTVHIMVGCYFGIDAPFFITIDGVRYGAAGNLTATPIASAADFGTENWRSYCVQIPNLSPGLHTVRITSASSNAMLVSYIAGFDKDSVQKPVVRVLSPIRMLQSSYSIAPANQGSDAACVAMQEAVRRTVNFCAASGMECRYVDVDTLWSPTASGLDGLAIHPLEHWHRQAKEQIVASLTGVI